MVSWWISGIGVTVPIQLGCTSTPATFEIRKCFKYIVHHLSHNIWFTQYRCKRIIGPTDDLLPTQREWVSMLIVNVNKNFSMLLNLHRQRVSTCPGKFATFYKHRQMTLLYKHSCKMIVTTKFATFYFVLLWSKRNQAVKFSSIMVKIAMLFLLFFWVTNCTYFTQFILSPQN